MAWSTCALPRAVTCSPGDPRQCLNLTPSHLLQPLNPAPSTCIPVFPTPSHTPRAARGPQPHARGQEPGASGGTQSTSLPSPVVRSPPAWKSLFSGHWVQSDQSQAQGHATLTWLQGPPSGERAMPPALHPSRPVTILHSQYLPIKVVHPGGKCKRLDFFSIAILWYILRRD